MKANQNAVVLEGYVQTDPIKDHITFGENIYKFSISIPRYGSDARDSIVVEISDRVMDIADIKIGTILRVKGQFRSFNKMVNGGRPHLQLYVFAQDAKILESTEGYNRIMLSGFLCKKPSYRSTPSGREICDVIIACNRLYNKADYLPVISWGRNARFVSNLKVGTGIDAEGRIQSRVYKKTLPDGSSEDRTAYEVSVSSIVLMSDEEVKLSSSSDK